MKVLLIGNQNCGKTAVFNRLTHSTEHTGNFAGVTVKTTQAHRGGIVFTDTPGVYSPNPFTLEEKVTKEAIDGKNYDIILNVVDATNLSRSLKLTLDLIKKSFPVIVAVNFSDRLLKNNAVLDFKKLSKMLGVPVFLISAKTGKGFLELQNALKKIPPKATPVSKSADEIARECLKGKIRDGEKSEKIDRIILNKWLCYPILIFVIFLMLTLVFGSFGSFLSECFSLLLSPVSQIVQNTSAPNWVKSLLCDAVIDGVGGVISFLPQIALLFLCICVLEDSGYMSRAVFLTDALFEKFGISGRAFIPLLMGLGCTTTAVMGAGISKNSREKNLTAMLTPFVPCSAKLPVYSLFCTHFFKNSAPAVIFSLYLIGFLNVAFWGSVLSKTVFKKENSSFFVELVNYRIPSVRDTAIHVFEKCKGFLTKASTVIFLSNVLLWLLSYFAEGLGKIIAPVLSPLGFGFWEGAVMLISGLGAKETVASTALSLNAISLFNPACAFSFMLFITLSPPCISALTALKKETQSLKLTVLCVVIELFSAYLFSFLGYIILS